MTGFEELKDNFLNGILKGYEFGKYRSNSRSIWQERVREVQKITQECNPEKPLEGLLAEPPPAFMDQKAYKEPDGLNPDTARQYRRALYQSQKAQGIVSNLKIEMKRENQRNWLHCPQKHWRI